MSHPPDEPMRAREEGLLVEQAGEDTVVYDLETHRAHSLARPAAFVWTLLDGTRSRDDLAAAVAAEIDVERPEVLVDLALEELGAAGLLMGRPADVPEGDAAGGALPDGGLADGAVPDDALADEALPDGTLPDDASAPGDDDVDRRAALARMARVAGLAAALPLVESVTAPLAAQAATCVPFSDCIYDRFPQCGGRLPICENRDLCCHPIGAWRTCFVRRC